METFSNPSISALVVNHNSGDDILKCLRTLIQQNTPLESIVVVDNASSDGSPAEISKHFPHVNIIQLEENFGVSRARNIGLSEINSEFVIIVDDDVYLDSECLSYLHQAQKEYAAAVVCPRVLLYPEKHIVQCDGGSPHFVGTMKLRHAFKPVAEIGEEAAEVQACIGACMLVDRKLALAGGRFDERIFFYFEDLEFAMRMRSLGHSIVCEPKALVYHDRGSGTPQLSFRGRGSYPKKRVYFNVRHRWFIILIHYKILTILVLSPILLAYEFATLTIVILRGWFNIWLKALKSVLSDRRYIADRRQFVQQNRKRQDRDILSGGELPIAQGFLSGKLERFSIDVLSWSMNSYWKLFRHWIG